MRDLLAVLWRRVVLSIPGKIGIRVVAITRGLLRKVFKWHIAPTGETIAQCPPYRLYAAFADCKGDNGANDNATETSKRNPFKKHAIAKKCHLCHLFYVLLQVYNRLCIIPEAFKVIIFALLGPEDVNDYPTQVQQDPASVSVSFAV
jgi:hypothetical protein